jgi:hypothetical protein
VLAASFISEIEHCDVVCWYETDMPMRSPHVRFEGEADTPIKQTHFSF